VLSSSGTSVLKSKIDTFMKGLDMKGLIDIEAVNEKVKEIEAKKAAIREAAECGQKVLDAKKPVIIKAIRSSRNSIIPITSSDNSLTGLFVVEIGGLKLQQQGRYSIENYYVGIENMQRFAACIIKAFGPIPQELIDSVVVE